MGRHRLGLYCYCLDSDNCKCKNTARMTSPSFTPPVPCGNKVLTAAPTSPAVTDTSPNAFNLSSKSACGEGAGDNFFGLDRRGLAAGVEQNHLTVHPAVAPPHFKALLLRRLIEEGASVVSLRLRENARLHQLVKSLTGQAHHPCHFADADDHLRFAFLTII